MLGTTERKLAVQVFRNPTLSTASGRPRVAVTTAERRTGRISRVSIYRVN